MTENPKPTRLQEGGGCVVRLAGQVRSQERLRIGPRRVPQRASDPLLRHVQRRGQQALQEPDLLGQSLGLGLQLGSLWFRVTPVSRTAPQPAGSAGTRPAGAQCSVRSQLSTVS